MGVKTKAEGFIESAAESDEGEQRISGKTG